MGTCIYPKIIGTGPAYQTITAQNAVCTTASFAISETVNQQCISMETEMRNKNKSPQEVKMKTLTRSTLIVLSLGFMLGGCYVLPMDRYGNPIYPSPPPSYGEKAPPPSPAKKTGPITISARLYPDSDLAAETGVITGTVTNMLTGKGRFNLSYKGETYTGEATRVSNDSRRGVASAFSPAGGYMSCEYQMNTPRQGAGTCIFDNGAKYKLHLGD